MGEIQLQFSMEPKPTSLRQAARQEKGTGAHASKSPPALQSLTSAIGGDPIANTIYKIHVQVKLPADKNCALSI
jgi:hypothetical protein